MRSTRTIVSLRFAMLGFVATSASGCAVVRPASPVAATGAASPAQRTAAAEIASRRFSELAGRGDSTGLESLLDESAVMFNAIDSVRGAPAIARRLTSSRTSSSRTELLVQSGERELCEVTGAYEVGSFSVYEHRDGASHVVTSGRYGIRWRDTDGGLAITRVILDTARLGNRAGTVYCPTLTRQEFRRRRVLLTVGKAVGSPNWMTHNDQVSQLRSRGWGPDVPYCTSTSTSGTTGYPGGFNCGETTRYTTPPIEMVGARVRITPMFGLEGFTQLGHANGTAFGYKGADSSFVIQSFTARERMALATVEWAGVRAGLGAAMVHADWHNLADRFIPQSDPLNPYRYGVAAMHQRLSTNATGLGMELVYAANVRSRFAFEVIVRNRVGVHANIPALDRYPDWRATFDGYSLAFGGTVGM